MAVLAFILMTQAQAHAAETLNDDGVSLGARQIDNALADNLGYGPLVSNWVSPARLLNDPDYRRWVTTLGALPIHVMDSDTLFAPPPPE